MFTFSCKAVNAKHVPDTWQSIVSYLKRAAGVVMAILESTDALDDDSPVVDERHSEKIRNELVDAKFSVRAFLLNMADYGAPTIRNRLFFVAIRTSPNGKFLGMEPKQTTEYHFFMIERCHLCTHDEIIIKCITIAGSSLGDEGEGAQ